MKGKRRRKDGEGEKGKGQGKGEKGKTKGLAKACSKSLGSNPSLPKLWLHHSLCSARRSSKQHMALASSLLLPREHSPGLCRAPSVLLPLQLCNKAREEALPAKQSSAASPGLGPGFALCSHEAAARSQGDICAGKDASLTLPLGVHFPS